VKKYVLDKYEKFCAEIFLHFIDIVILVPEYFILTHPVHVCNIYQRGKTSVSSANTRAKTG